MRGQQALQVRGHVRDLMTPKTGEIALVDHQSDPQPAHYPLESRGHPPTKSRRTVVKKMSPACSASPHSSAMASER